MPPRREHNLTGLITSIENLPYVRDCGVGETDSGDECIQIGITVDGYGPVFKDVTDIAREHQIVRTKQLTTVVSLDRETNTVFFTPV